jgi:hypothetical protein
MRAKDILSENEGSRNVTINIPITITIPNGGGDPVVSAAPGNGELPGQPVFVPPLQQSLELEKHKSGKRSTVINQILDDNGAFSEDNERTEFDIVEDFEELSAEYNRLVESQKSL